LEWRENPEDLHCNGCKSQTLCIYCRDCDIKLCAEEKELEFCFECSQFPCDRLISFNRDKYPHHHFVLRNLYEIQQIGKEKWMNRQKKRWTCMNCDTPFEWYSEHCTSCGTRVYNAKDEDEAHNFELL
jgi:hypothetical protein